MSDELLRESLAAEQLVCNNESNIFMIGTRLLDRYEIVREVGRGGMGVVYLAHDPVLDRDVAVKVVNPELVSSESVERFKREARVVAKMDHPGIVTVYDSGEHQNSLFFIMPFVDGTNLRSILKEDQLSLGDLIEIGTRIAEALEYSHSRGVIHRDIKPENIMITRKDSEGLRVRVTDFGLAMGPSQDRLTKTAAIVGTIAYMSPEQISGRELDARSDIYSFATVLYECLTGQTPFSGEVQSLIYRIAHEIPNPPRNIQPEIDDEINDLIIRCLDKDPARRPIDREVVESLSRYRQKLQSTGRIGAMLPSSATLSFQYQRPAMRAFVGREKEFAELQKRLNAAVAGECQFMLVSGEAGIGKSRLLEELKTLAKVRGITVLNGRFVEVAHPLPYQGFCDAIQEYFRGRSTTQTPVDFSDLSRDLISLFPVLAEIRELASSLDEAARIVTESSKKFEDRTYIFELLARTLTRIAGGKPLVLLMEDLHSANVSIEALDYIARRLSPTQTLIIGTYRSTEVDKRHPITNLLSGFKGDRRFGLIQLEPLSQSGHRLYLQELMNGSTVDDATAKKFYEATEGNPFFTSELIRSLLDSGAILRDESGSYKLSSETALAIEELPVTIQQTVEERIERLPKEHRDVLSIASVLGRTFDYRDLEALVTEENNLEESIEQLLKNGFIEEDRQTRSDLLSFSSGVVRDVLYASLPRRRRRSLHRKHAEELEKRNQGRLERVSPQLFEHYVQGDVSEKVVEYGFLLAQKSLSAFSPDDAIRTLQTVLDFLQEEAGSQDAIVKARTMLAISQEMSGNLQEALDELEAALKILIKEKQPGKQLSTCLLASEIAWRGMRVDETRKWADRGLLIPTDEEENVERVKLLGLAATVANMRGEYEKAREYLEKAERLKPPSEETQEEVPRGGTLLVAFANACTARHPAHALFIEESEFISNVFETLVTTDTRGNLVPLLCEKWIALNDGSTFQFILRRGVHLQDGRRLTAPDVKVAFEESVRMSSLSLVPALSTVQGVEEFLNGTTSHVSGITTPAENVIQFDLLAPLPIYPALLTDVRMSVAVRANGQEETYVGTGHFRITSSENDRLLVERNDAYWKGTASNLDAIEFHIVKGSAEMAEGFRNGSYDVARDLLPADLEKILQDKNVQGTLIEAPRKNTYFVIFNSSSTNGSLPAIRQAMVQAIRTHDIVRSALGRFAQPAEGLLPPGILGYDPNRRTHSAGVERAREILETARVELPVELTASVHPLLQDRYGALLKALLESWRELGIEIKIKYSTTAEYNDSWINNEGIDLLMGRWFADYDDPDAFVYSLFRSGVGEFRKYYSSHDLDQLMDQARSLSNPQEREKLYRKIDGIFSESAVLIPLFHEIDYRLIGPKVHNFTLRSTPPFINYAEAAKIESSPDPSRSQGLQGVIRVLEVNEVKNMFPGSAITNHDGIVHSTVYETLTRASSGARIIPWLASRYDSEEEGRRYRFHLRPDLRFHDGRRLTARDVRYTFEYVLRNGAQPNQWLLSSIAGAKEFVQKENSELKGFRIVSTNEFVVELNEPLPFFPAILAYAGLCIIPEGAKSFSGTWRDGVVGTGPFRITEFESGKSLKLEANPNYWVPGYPRCKRLEMRFKVPPSDVFKGLLDGSTLLARELYPRDVDAILHDMNSGINYREIPSLSTYYLIFNTRREPFSNLAIRRKFMDAVDTETLVRRSLGRLAFPAQSLIPPALLGFQPFRKQGSSGTRRSSETIEIAAIAHSAFEAQYAGLTRELIRVTSDAGFKIRIVNSQGEFCENYDQLEADIILTRWMGDYPDADTFAQLLNSKKDGEGRWCGGPELDRLIKAGRTESDPYRRHGIYRQFEEILQDHALILPLFHEQTYCFARPEVEGLELNFFTPYLHFEKLRITR